MLLFQQLTGADSGGGAPGAPPPLKKEREREREREREERGSKEETIRSIRGKTSAEAFVISWRSPDPSPIQGTHTNVISWIRAWLNFRRMGR